MQTPVRKLLAVAVLAGMASTAQAFEDGKLVIWGERGADAWAEIGAAFEADTGVAVVIENPDPITEKFQQAASTGDGPDLIFFAHDRFGDWANSGLISAVDVPAELKKESADFAWSAVTIGDKVYGFPIFAEAVSLIYNKNLIPNPPSSFEEILAGDVKVPAGVQPILWDYNNTYFSMPLLHANGGYAFAKKDGVYDGKDTGVNNAGAKQGAAVIKQLIDNGMPAGADYGIMDSEFAAGKVGMIINGPWSWGGYEQAGIDIGLAQIPSINGNASKPFVGVFSVATNAASPNKDLAKLFMEEYVMTNDGLGKLATSLNGAMVNSAVAATQDDPRLAITLENAANGIAMPNNPEMGAFWGAMGPALANISGGQQSADAALDDAAKRILSGE